MSNSPAPAPGTERTLRSRRRPRTSDGDTLKVAKRRKRNKVSEDTFVAPRYREDEDEVNGTIEVAPMNEDVHHESTRRGRGRPRKASTPIVEMEIPVRGKKNITKRPARGDGATVLTQNERYSVKLLPSTPKELWKSTTEYRGSLGAAHNALAVTRDRAYVWDYTSHGQVSNPRVFDIPFATKATDPLPFGALVTTGNSTDIGLVLLSAVTGKVVFYDSIERAAAIGLFQDRNAGVEGSAGSLSSGESVTDLISADHAGFVIIFSSGRIAQLTLRDAQGKARVFAQLLRSTEHSSGGLFGSIKGMLGGGGAKRDVAALHTRALGTRGQMQAISLTERAELQIWDLDWSGRYTFKGTIGCREVIVAELRRLDSPEVQGRAENIATLDFAMLEKPTSNNELTTIGAETPIDFVLLVRSGTSDKSSYVLVEMSVAGAEVAVNQVLELDTYRVRSGVNAQTKPRLILPKPRHTAFVAFGDALVLAAIGEAQKDSPEAQLNTSYVQPANFEESIYLQQNNDFVLLDACGEDSRGNLASSIAFVRGAGLVRISAVDPVTTEPMDRIPIKTRIEQAVFHGALQDCNIIDFSRVQDSVFSPEEVEQAAVQISDKIMRSKSPFISTSPTSMESHLAQKANALRALVTYVRQNYPTLSKAAMWQLLWDAERVAAGQQMWKAFEEHESAATAERKKRTATVMDEVCAVANPRTHLDSAPDQSNSEVVRLFFIHRLHRIELLLPLICEFLEGIQNDTEKPALTKFRLVLEADDLWIRSLETVSSFRMENAAAYGVLRDQLDEGVLTNVAEYAELPEFWTSTETMLKSVKKMCKLSRSIAQEEFDKNEEDPTVQALAMKVSDQNPQLIQLMCLIFQERINWLASRQEAKQREMSEKLWRNYDDTRYDQFRVLANMAQFEAGLKLAEKYRDMHTLTEIVVGEMQFSLEELPKESDARKQKIVNHINDLMERIGRYFERFGDDWANAYFDEGFGGGAAGVMFNDAQDNWPEALSRYLRADPSRAKLCWINDVTAANDLAHASESLKLAAKERETMLWPKQVELSMAKLAVLATQEGLQENDRGMTEHDIATAMPESELEIVGIQEKLFKHLLPEIKHCIDEQAELEVTTKKFGHKIQDLHACKSVLEAGFDRVLRQEAVSVDELVDVLTLMDSVINDDTPDNLQGQEFFLALKALNAAAPSMPQTQVETLLQLLWKRCYLYDDWIDINKVSKQSDEEVSSRLKETMPWRTLYHVFDQGFFDRPDCCIRILLPSDCLGGGCSPEDLAYRWPEADILTALLNENKIQDEQLHGYVTDRRLDQWVETCIRDVKNYLEEERDEEAQRLQREREFEASVELGQPDGKANGHATAPNGIKAEDGGEQSGFETDGDVEME
ncbi:hypothetical protein LTR37_013026 [Vermiconidia calcicola]|uniref:Uncharacterized protein n=1 Tax=Vermiconidia calcicola TaxID=1690605 RepID=A0ACC3MZD4_9PEZI|nr:hypothetical protein LTR37_013026 [Vermiconidia calcicola]